MIHPRLWGWIRGGIILMSAILASTVASVDAHAAEPNLLTNTSFTETNPTDTSLPAFWNRGNWGTNQATFRYPVVGFDDAYAVQVDLLSHSNGDAKWYTAPVTVTPGETYTYTDRYLASVATYITAEFHLSTGAVHYVDLATPASANTWATTEVRFTAPTNAQSVTIYHLLPQVGSLTIDTPSLTRTVVTPPPSEPGNLLVNGTFETASGLNPAIPEGWSPGSWGTNDATFHYPVSGSASARAASVTMSSYTNGDAKWSFAPIATTSANPLLYTDQYQATVPTILTAAFVRANGTTLYQDLATLPASTGWREARVNVTPPSDVRSITIFHLLNCVGTLTIDSVNVSVTSLPAPNPNNLIVNADLSQPSAADQHLPANWTQGHWGTNTAVYTYPVPGPSTGNALQLNVTSYTNGDAKWTFDAVPVTPGLIYRYSETYTASVPSVVTVRYDFPDGTASYADLLRLTAATTWTPLQVDISPPTGASSMTIFHLLQQVGTLSTADFRLPQPLPGSTSSFSEGMVSFTFDDGYLSGYDVARPLLNQAHIKGTFYLVNDYLDGSDPFYMNLSQALVLNRDGHEVGGHTRTHPFLTELTPAQRADEIIQARHDQIALGFSPMTTFAYPYGEYNASAIQDLKTAGYSGARSVHTGFNDKLSDPFLLMDQHVESNTTPANVQAWIAQAKANKTWLILELHQQDYSGDQYSNTPETLQAIIQAVQASGIKTVTVNEGLQLMQR